MKKEIIRQMGLFLAVFCSFCSSALAYIEDFPPYRFEDGPPKHLQTQPLSSEIDHRYDYTSKDGKIVVRAVTKEWWIDKILIKDGDLILVDEEELRLRNVYRVDIDGNGFKDIIIFKDYMGAGSASWYDMVEIFLKEKEGVYHRITYTTQNAQLEDFIDLGDGKYAVIVCSQSGWQDAKDPGSFHVCFHYNIYEFENFKPVNANAKHKGFPKFVWWRYKPNDEDAWQMTKEAKEQAVKEMDADITYQRITKR